MTPGQDEGSERPQDGGAARSLAGGVQGLAARYGVLVILFLLVGGFSLALPDTFPTEANLVAIVGSAQVIIILGLGVTLTLRIGDLDLSFGAVMGTAAVLISVITTQHGVGTWTAIAIALLFGAACGAFNAFLVVVLGLNAFVATLGTMTIFGGIGYQLSDSTVVVGVSPGISTFFQEKLLGIPHGAWLGWALVVLIWFIYQWTPFGRMLVFIGGNREAARLLGLPVKAVRFIAYVLAGVMFATGGIVLVGTIGTADPTSGGQYLLPPLAAAFLGTSVIQPGRFNAFGTLIGAYVLAVISTGLALLGLDAWVSEVFNGAVLIGALALVRFAHRDTAADSHSLTG